MLESGSLITESATQAITRGVYHHGFPASWLDYVGRAITPEILQFTLGATTAKFSELIGAISRSVEQWLCHLL